MEDNLKYFWYAYHTARFGEEYHKLHAILMEVDNQLPLPKERVSTLKEDR